MAFTINGGSDIDGLTMDGVELESLFIDGVEVWKSSIILARHNLTKDTGKSLSIDLPAGATLITSSVDSTYNINFDNSFGSTNIEAYSNFESRYGEWTYGSSEVNLSLVGQADRARQSLFLFINGSVVEQTNFDTFVSTSGFMGDIFILIVSMYSSSPFLPFTEINKNAGPWEFVSEFPLIEGDGTSYGSNIAVFTKKVEVGSETVTASVLDFVDNSNTRGLIMYKVQPN